MGHLLFAAHDPGGANLLLPVMAAARSAGHRLSLAPAGPATAIWARGGEVAPESGGEGDPDGLLDGLAPDLVVTGTGFGSFERHLWLSARARGIGSVAAIDAWTNLRRRFAGPDDDAQPDVLCLIDGAMRDEIVAGGWCRSRLCVTGQPHLQVTTRRLREARQGRRPSARPLVAFFSEPVRQDYGGVEAVGYDQVTAIDAIVAGLDGSPPVTLLIQPHPREDAEEWRAWRATQEEGERLTILVGDGPADAVLAGSDAVLGMTTMVLLEAHLAGIPALAVQPGRRRAVNLLFDRVAGIDVMTEPRDLPARLTRLLGELRRPVVPDSAFAAILEKADRRVLYAIEEELQKKRESD